MTNNVPMGTTRQRTLNGLTLAMPGSEGTTADLRQFIGAPGLSPRSRQPWVWPKLWGVACACHYLVTPWPTTHRNPFSRHLMGS